MTKEQYDKGSVLMYALDEVTVRLHELETEIDAKMGMAFKYNIDEKDEDSYSCSVFDIVEDRLKAGIIQYLKEFYMKEKEELQKQFDNL